MSTALWQVDIAHVKPECFFQYLKLIPNAVEIIKRHGATPINQYWVEAGGAPEVVYITKYESFAEREKIMETYLKDPEMLELFKTAAPCVYAAQNYVCFANPEVGINHPKSQSSKKMMEMIKVGHPTEVGSKMTEMMNWWKAKFGEDCPEPLVLLHPIFFTHQCVIVIAEVPGDLDAVMKKYGEVMMDAKNWPKINEAFHEFDVQSLRLLNPISNLNL